MPEEPTEAKANKGTDETQYYLSTSSRDKRSNDTDTMAPARSVAENATKVEISEKSD